MVPMEPAPDGNGLAMRAARFVSGASAHFSVVVLVLPVAGAQHYRQPSQPPVPTRVIPIRPSGSPAPGWPIGSSPGWRRRLEATLPFPPGANLAPPTMVEDVLAAIGQAGLPDGTPIHVMRSYLAPLGTAVAERLGSAWCTLDLDDDDESVTASLGRGEQASAYHRLIATFGPCFDAVCAAAPLDASALEQRFGFTVSVVRNAVAMPDAVRRNRAVPPELLFVGNLNYPPNIEAATMLATQIVPATADALRRPVDAHLVGPGEASIRHLGRLPGIRVPGYVEDLVPYYERASAVVVPLAHGGGTSIKVLEAFARCVPVVATRAGVRGLGVEDGTHVLLGESPVELAAATAAIVRDPSRGDSLAQAARGFVERTFGAARADAEAGQFLLGAATRSGQGTRRPGPRPAADRDTPDSR
jgi:glycosyltransferase involved in cell wall biosynthesis